MWSDKSVAKFLAARDQRQEALAQALRAGCAYPATLFLSLNIPGPEKSPPGATAIFSWMLDELTRVIPGLLLPVEDCDALGPYAIAWLPINPLAAKKHCIGLEEKQPAARLLDLDVYSGSGRQIDRAWLDLPGRPCLLCAQPAVDCIRVQRHPLDQVIGKAHELLAHFSA